MEPLPLFDTLESWDGLAWLRHTVDGKGVCHLDHNLQGPGQVNGVEGGHFKMVLLKQSHDMTARLQ